MRIRQKKYGGGFAWQKPITSSYPEEGFCIPYRKYWHDDELSERLAIKPLKRTPFKYESREVTNDDAVEVNPIQTETAVPFCLFRTVAALKFLSGWSTGACLKNHFCSLFFVQE